MNGSFMCLNGGPHFFTGGDRCVCGVEEGYVLVKRSEHERLTVDLAEARAAHALILDLSGKNLEARQRWHRRFLEARAERAALLKITDAMSAEFQHLYMLQAPEQQERLPKILDLLDQYRAARHPAAVTPEAGEGQA
jgi:hypothetical protein